MFVRYYLELDRPCEVIARLLTDWDHGEWLTVVEESGRWEGALVARVGVGPAPERSRVREQVTIGSPVPFGGGCLVPISWRSSDPRATFPRVEADLQVAPLGRVLTQLSINARYEPSPSGRGTGLDRPLRHRVAEAVVGDLLRRVASALRARLEAREGA